MAKPDWRKIETALIDLLREEGFTIKQEEGESYIELTINDHQHQIVIGDFAKELVERL